MLQISPICPLSANAIKFNLICQAREARNPWTC